MTRKIIEKLEKIFPQELLVTYVLVGIWNTIFGTLAYFLCVWCFNDIGRFGYMIGAVISTIVSVTQSFLSYKFFVFKTKGNYLAEYCKCWGVYGTATIINLLLLPLCVETCRFILPVSFKNYAAYIGGLILMGITVIISFIGHKNITFKQNKS